MRAFRRWSSFVLRHRLVTGMAVFLLGIASLTVVGATVHLNSGAGSAGADPTCQIDGSGGCTATIPCQTAACPTVTVTPASDVVDGQYVTIKTTNFASGDSMRMALCSTLTSATDPSCLWGPWDSEYHTPANIPVVVDPVTDNLTEDAYPVFFDQSGDGNSLMPAHDVTNNVGTVPGFYCDNAPDVCAIYVTEEQGTVGVGAGPLDSPSNTVAIPLTFAAQDAGCSSSAPVVSTESSFSMEHFLPAAVDATCKEADGVVDINTANDTHSVVSDFASGSPSAQIVFLDNPDDAAQAAILSASSHDYAYIPVAVSATVVGMLAGDTDGETEVGIPTFNLTPNMVAGLITSSYEVSHGYITSGGSPIIADADNLVSALGCNRLKVCADKNLSKQLTNELPYDSFDLLNPVPAGYIGPLLFDAAMSDVANGASYQATDWLCNAPNAPITVKVDEKDPGKGGNPTTVTVTDPNAAPGTLTTAPFGSAAWPPRVPAAWVYPSCHAYSTFPPLATNSGYGEYENPALQAANIRNVIYGGGSSPGFPLSQPEAGFGIMDSSDASFFGLNTASLQNADGNFVEPTAANVEASLSNLSPCPVPEPTCPTGTYQLNYQTAPTDQAYPMPDITYALVPTSPQPAQTAAAEKDLLTNLVTYSHNGGSSAHDSGSTGPLPGGYSPLPDSLYGQAMADIAADIVAGPPGSSGKSGPGSSSSGSSGTSGQSGSGSGSSGSNGSGSFSSEGGTTGTSEGSSLPLTTAQKIAEERSRGLSAGSVYQSQSPTGVLLVSLDTIARFLLPALVVLAVVCLIAGPLLFLPEWRRRRRADEGTP